MEIVQLSRSKNFSNSEMNLLIQLVNENRRILERKQTGAITHKQKAGAWAALEVKFNAVSSEGNYRSAKVLKEKWTNIKRSAVKNFAADKKFRKGTGGGPDEPPKETPIEAVVNDILGERLTGLPSECDSDCQTQNEDISQMENVVIAEVIVHRENDDDNIWPTAAVEQIGTSSQECNSNEPDITVDWSNYTPQMLQSTPSRPLQTSSRKSKTTGAVTNAKWCDLTDKKNELAATKLTLMTREDLRKQEIHEITKRHLEETHEQKLRHEEEEHTFKLKLLQEEHNCKLKMLEKNSV